MEDGRVAVTSRDRGDWAILWRRKWKVSWLWLACDRCMHMGNYTAGQSGIVRTATDRMCATACGTDQSEPLVRGSPDDRG